MTSSRRARTSALAALLLGLAACTRGNPAVTGMGSARRGDLIQKVTMAGNVVPRKKTLVTPPYDGYISRIYVGVGDRVKAGAPVVSITQSLKHGEENFPLRAPFAGTVVQVLHYEGEYVEKASADNRTIVRIDDLDQLNVLANAPEMDIGKLKLGQEAVIKASSNLNRVYHGVIESISLASKDEKDWERSRVEFPITIRVTDQDRNLEPGMSVILDVVTRKAPNVLMLGHEYVQKDPKDNDQYFVVLADGTKRKIQVGLENEDSFEVKAGLTEGEPVKVTDYLSLVKDL